VEYFSDGFVFSIGPQTRIATGLNSLDASLSRFSLAACCLSPAVAAAQQHHHAPASQRRFRFGVSKSSIRPSWSQPALHGDGLQLDGSERNLESLRSRLLRRDLRNTHSRHCFFGHLQRSLLRPHASHRHTDGHLGCRYHQVWQHHYYNHYRLRI